MDKSITIEFQRLVEVLEKLMGPQGCPWDRNQTLVSMRESILEEACEVIEAIDEGSDEDLIEELGDLLYNVLFFSKLAEKEERFSIEKPIRRIREKLIHRHPHVFGGKELSTEEEIINQWEEIKKKEKSHRESLLDGIPKGLPALGRAYKIAGKMEKSGVLAQEGEEIFENEELLGIFLWKIVRQARRQGLNPESALRKKMVDVEREFRIWEKSSSPDI